MPIEAALAAYLDVDGYHPRSSKHSDFQSLIIIRDLVMQCPSLGAKAARGEVVTKLRHHQQVGHADWVIDIAIGTCAGAPVPPEQGAPIRFDTPVMIQIAIELKGIFTEHGKARRNRLRDFQAFHGYAHQYDNRTVAAAFLVVNAAQYFYSPLRREDDLTEHAPSVAAARALAERSVALFRAIHLRNSLNDPPGLEALGVTVVEHDNIVVHPNPGILPVQRQATRISPVPPSLALGDPLHYETMIQRICMQYSQRF
ncbi:hypothetical protein [Bradyrhizobium sp. URHD0069]|uniref:hypothetical protein n=1 Tax=Bradyrhizobium sp. URHD0069 TaxID=1380355 RepID=UPI000496D3DD|nr:hypothetical protein [Bradyrhizobium sp. URHD0069]